MSKLLGYDFEIQYRLGLENKAADALSRMLNQGEFASLTRSVVLDLQSVGAQVDVDPYLARIKRELQAGSKSWKNYTLVQGRLLYKGRLVLPINSSLIKAILSEFHTGLIGRHSGFLRTYKRIIQEFYWVGMKGDIKKFVAECGVCQMNKTLALSLAGVL